MKEAPIIDYDNLDKKIEEMRAEIEADKKERIARGLPPERPDRFVDREVSKVLADKVEHLFDYAKGYGALLVRTKTLQPTQYDAVYRKYSDYILLLNESIDLGYKWRGDGLRILLKTLKLIDRDEVSYEKASRGFYNVFLTMEISDMNLNQFNEKPLPDIDEERLEKLQSDDSFLQSEVQRYLEHYESIKHLF
ncbi:hypothetical protein V7183_12110 [Bacillus sp. JJ1127]|uniref:hypothetical protein n=1 Tax=Bacillus sp. JJ1127 TaxID=3122952 RepID=UPI002FFD7EA6